MLKWPNPKITDISNEDYVQKKMPQSSGLSQKILVGSSPNLKLKFKQPNHTLQITEDDLKY